MTDIIHIEPINDVHVKVHCDSGIAHELQEYFTFVVPGAKFMPAVRNKMWDGKIRLFNPVTRTIYGGLVDYLQRFAAERDYEVTLDDRLADSEFSLNEAQEFIASIPLSLKPRDYQVDAFVHAARKRRALLLSPTASGKSFIIFLLTLFSLKQQKGKVLIVVPTTSLVHQMVSDFHEYAPSLPKEMCHKILAGQDKETDSNIVVSTWQSIYQQPKKWFQQFTTVIGDEAHLFKAKSLTGIMDKLVVCPHRFGFTGTLDGTQTHKLVLEGLFGAVKKVTTTAELIEQKHLADFLIKAIVLHYSDAVRESMKNSTYQDEMDFLVRHEPRNNFIKNLALSLSGNTLLLFQYVDKHGKHLYNMLKDSGREVYYVAGDVDGDEREDIRRLVETKSDAIIVASYGTFSTGVNIKNLHNIIFASPSKSRIRNLQSIGRGLRKSDTKDSATLFDIADNLTWKSWKNHTINHFAERIKTYSGEGFEYKIYTVKLKE